jgi:F420H(2)-dependent quinone reductase
VGEIFRRPDPKAPGWYHNLMAKPDIEINVGPKRFVVTATPLLPDDPDCPRLWEIVKKEQRQPLQELS